MEHRSNGFSSRRWMRPIIRLTLLGSTLACRNDPTGADATVHERWYETQPGYGRARPAVLNDVVYFGTGDGQVIARDASTGKQRWSVRTGTDAISGANLIARSGVVVAPAIFFTVGLDAETGRELWRYRAPDDTTGVIPSNFSPGTLIDSRIDADDENAYIPAWGASVSAVDLHTGALRWVWQPGRIAGDTAASVFRSGSMGTRVSGDTVFGTLWHYVNRQGGTSEPWVVALNRTTGVEFWRVKLPYQGSGALIEAAPAVYKNLVIVHTLSARTYAIDRTTQEIAWEFISPAARVSTIAGPELYGNVVYVDAGDQHISALGASDGRILWSADAPGGTNRDLLVTERRVTFSNGGTLYVIDRQSGRQIVAVTQPRTYDPLFASPAAFANGLIFVTVAGAAWAFDEP